MKPVLALFVLSLMCISACKKPETFCGAKNPMNEIGWLKEEVQNSSYEIWIYKLKYKEVEGFLIRICFKPNSNCSTGGFTYYKTCDNTLLYQAGGVVGSTFPNDFEFGSTYKELIYPN